MNTLETHTIAQLPKLELHTFVIKRTVVTVDMGSQDKYILLEAPIAYLIMMFEKVVLVMTPYYCYWYTDLSFWVCHPNILGIQPCYSVYDTQMFRVWHLIIQGITTC